MNFFKKSELVIITNGQYNGKHAEVFEYENSMVWVMVLTTTEVICIPASDLKKFDYTKLNNQNKSAAASK